MPSVMCVLFALFFAMNSGATNSGTPSVSADPSTVLNVQFSAEPTQYDPLLLEDGTALRLAANTVGTLYEYDGDGNLNKSLVSQISISRDRKRYSFKFKKGLKWSDGKPFHAEQFILAIRRLVNEPVKAALSDLFPAFDLLKTRAIDALTAEVVLKEKDGQFLNWLTLPPFAPIRQDMIDAYQQKITPVVPTLAAYQVTDYKREDSITLKKNDFYDRKDQVAIDQVKIRFIKDEASLLPLLKNGNVDILCKVPVLQLDEIRSVSSLFETPVEAVTYLAFNTKKAPFNDVKNRQWFRDALAPKKGELAKILKTGEIAANTFLPAILIPAGTVPLHPFAKGKPSEKYTFNIQSDVGSRNQTILEYVQSILKDEVSWKANLDLIDWKAHYGKLKVDPDEVYRFGWQNPVSDPFVMYQVMESKSPNNFTGWSNPAYDGLVEELRNENRAVKKGKLIEKIEAILWNEAPVVPVLHQVLRFAHSKRVQGFRANSFGVILFRELHFAKK
jgi:oligopeptide transport system substrate-binding protein